MSMVDFTQATFDELNAKTENYKENEQALLNHFIEETKDIAHWHDMAGTMHAITWMYNMLCLAKENQKLDEDAIDGRLSKFNPDSSSVSDVLDIFQNMGTYDESVKSAVGKIIEQLNEHLKKNAPTLRNRKFTGEIYYTQNKQALSVTGKLPTSREYYGEKTRLVKHIKECEEGLKRQMEGENNFFNV